MTRSRTMFAVLATALLCAPAVRAAKLKTGTEQGNLFTDLRYGFTMQKNADWKFKIFEEKPDRPTAYRFRLQKSSYQVPTERQFARETWTPAYGGLFIDTTSLTYEQVKTLLAEENRKDKFREAIAKQAEIIRDGLLVDEKRTTLGNLGSANQLTFKQEYSAQTKDFRGNYNIITDHLMGEFYIKVEGGRLYLFFFTAERAEYRLCKEEMERVLASLTFPGRGKAGSASPAQEDTTKAREPKE